ncbi:hypothetical protein I3843_04G074900 [Carya illinoinensis]|uniref:Methyltransferase n=1 Tax=Carya illinoinensis TaxID=32201 RepID=A0A922F6W7_CARIL|nr:hypothetical protein I3842_04G080500 [Carya illinoinensis]KAG7982869.1 hypothetical protein I3843_04G074900 [Carya illinoinensis]
MALGKYSRVDNRRSSSSYCSTVSIVVFVALCLVGVWMMTSSSVVPVQNVDVPQENKNEAKEQVSESNGGVTRQFEDNSGDLPEDVTKGDTNLNSESHSKSEGNQDEKSDEKPVENPEEKPEENPEEKPEDKPEENPEESLEEKPEERLDENSEEKLKEKPDEGPNSDGGEAKTDGGENGSGGQGGSEESSAEKKSENPEETKDGEKAVGQIDEKVDQNGKKETDENSGEKKENGQAQNQSLNNIFPSGAQSELLNETTTQSGAWSTQVTESKNEKDIQKLSTQQTGYSWKLCNVTAGPDYIPCLDNWEAIKNLRSGKLLLELNRVLRPGGFFVWSATPIYRKTSEDVEIWSAMKDLTKAMCWELVSINKDTVNEVGAATFKKPISNECYEKRSQSEPPICPESDDPNAAWNVPLQACMHKVPVDTSERGSQWPEQWPARLEKPPYWLLSSQVGVYGKAAPDDFTADYEHWKRVVTKSYLNGMGVNWSNVRNAMDMRSVYGGLAAALKDLKIWVMNVVAIDSPDTLPIIYERGLFGIYHDWCESFSTYPRSYDLLHADHLFSKVKKRCNLAGVVVEVDRILRPEGKLIVRDNVETINELENMLKSMQWEVHLTYSRDNEGLLSVQKSMWRPNESETLQYAIA